MADTDTREGRIKQISKINGFVGGKFPETAKIRQEQNEGEKGQGLQCAHVDSDRLHEGPTATLSSV